MEFGSEEAKAVLEDARREEVNQLFEVRFGDVLEAVFEADHDDLPSAEWWAGQILELFEELDDYAMTVAILTTLMENARYNGTLPDFVVEWQRTHALWVRMVSFAQKQIEEDKAKGVL